MIGQGELTSWSEFGLQGLIIFALFSGFAVVIKWMINHIDKKDERHFEERMRWRESIDELLDEFKRCHYNRQEGSDEQ